MARVSNSTAASLSSQGPGRAGGRAGRTPAPTPRRGRPNAPRLGVPGQQAQHAGLAVGLDVGAAGDAVADDQRQDVVAVAPLRSRLVDLDQVRGSRARARRTAGPTAGCRTARAAPTPPGRAGLGLGPGLQQHRRAAVGHVLAPRARPRQRASSTYGRMPAMPPLQPPVLDDARLGERAAGARPRARTSRASPRPRPAPARPAPRPGSPAPAGRTGAGSRPARRSRAGPPSTAPPASAWPASGSTCRRRSARPRSGATPAAPRSRISPSTRSASAGSRSMTSPHHGWSGRETILLRASGQSLDREQACLVRPVLEHAARAQQLRHRPRRVAADAREQRQPVAALDGRDRVELHGAQPADRLRHVVRPARPRYRVAYPWAATTCRRSAASVTAHTTVPRRGEVLEQVGAGEHPGRPAAPRDDHGRAAGGQVGEHAVERLGRVDRAQRRLHGLRHLVVQGVGVLEHAVEQPALAAASRRRPRAIRPAASGPPAAARSSSAASARSPRRPCGAPRS